MLYVLQPKVECGCGTCSLRVAAHSDSLDIMLCMSLYFFRRCDNQSTVSLLSVLEYPGKDSVVSTCIDSIGQSGPQEGVQSIWTCASYSDQFELVSAL